MMTETTEKTQLPEAEKTPIQAADIAIIVESAAKEKTPRLAPVIEVKPLVAKEYVDPQSQDYLVEKINPSCDSFDGRSSRILIKLIPEVEQSTRIFLLASSLRVFFAPPPFSKF